MEKRKNRRKRKNILSIILTVMMAFSVIPLTGNMTVYADSVSVTQKCPEKVHDGCSHSSVCNHFYSTGNTYIPKDWPSYLDPEYCVEGILYNRDVEAEGVYQTHEKIICAKDKDYSFRTSYFKKGFGEGWYYDTGDGLYPCTESGNMYYTLTVIDGSVTAGGSGPCASIAQGTSVTIKAKEAPKGKVFDKWEVSAAGITTDEAKNAVISESAIITSTADIVMPNENITFRATYKTKPTVTPNFTTSPTNDSIVENINEVVLTFPDNENVFFSNLKESYTYSDAVKNSEGEIVCGATLSWGDGYNQIKLAVESEITTAGAYTISIPGGVIKVDGTEITEAITLIYTVSSGTPTTYKVTFNANGHGTSPAEQTGITSGSKATKPADPTETGYTFGGWYKEAGCTNVWDFTTDTVTNDTTLYAKWTQNSTPPSGGGNSGGSTGGDSTGVNKVYQSTVVIKPDGTKVETIAETKLDGTKVETVTETKPDGTRTEKVTEVKPDGTKTEKEKVSTPDKKVTEKEKITSPDGAVKMTEKVTQPDGTVEEKTTKISADGRTEAVIEIAYYVDGKLAGASLGVAQITEDNTMFVDFSDLKAAISGLGEDVLSKGADIEIKLTSKDEDGAVRYTIAINVKDLEETELVVYAIDKQGNPVIVNPKQNHVKIEESGEMILNIAGTGDFQLFNTADAKVAEKAILKTITPKKKNDSVKKEKKIAFKLSSKCNKDNISKITYKANNKNVKVDKKGNIKGKKKGNATVTATITLKNGKQKKVTMKVKVK